MIPTKLERITQEIRGELLRPSPDLTIERICTDSRGASPGSLFVALKGENTDGHRFLADAFRNGATAAMVAQSFVPQLALNSASAAQWPVIVVSDPLRGLQALARWQRREFLGTVLAITGSNGKTVVKDALKALLAGRRVLASPGSYNSQLGLPLAILSAEQPEPLAILEVGISAPGEMAPLEEVAAPDFGILTNIGMAHFAAFGSREAIAREKMILFSRIQESGWVLLPADEPTIEEPARKLRCTVHRVGAGAQALSLTPVSMTEDGQGLELRDPEAGARTVSVKTRSTEIISDLHVAASAAYLLGLGLDEIAAGLDGYLPTPTRMELWSSPQGVRLINDAYSSDPISVHAALRSAVLGAPRAGRKIFAFAGMRELGESSENEHRRVGAEAGQCGFNQLFLVGNGDLQSTAEGFETANPQGSVTRVGNPDELKDQLLPLLRPGDTVLFKGPRNAGMVKAVQDLSGAIAQRCLWVNLAAVAENIARIRRHCHGQSHIVAMLKAFSYGTGLSQLASGFSRLGIHHVGVSSANEGVAIRRSGAADQDIFVFLSDREDLDNLVRYRLTPVIYSAELVEAFIQSLTGTEQHLDVHLKIDTGMHRLGVPSKDALALAERIRKSGAVRLTGVCTHLAAADDPKSDEFTRQQISVFDHAIKTLEAAGFDKLQIHAANTAAAIRFPETRYNMIRVGLGLYGLYPSEAVRQALDLELAIGLTSRITSIQEFGPGETLGYNRTYAATRKTKVGVVPFGYDDGLPWALSGKGYVLVEGHPAPIVGRISMDQMQLDISDIKGVNVGAEVLLYGTHHGHLIRPESVADQAGTILHELLTRMGRRIHRIYIEPS
ncbi:MAG TPA: alanine racemase [Candidatus Angelobacter sp.]